MKRLIYFLLSIPFFVGLLFSCEDDGQTKYQSFDPTKPIEITGFYPDSGGIATPIIIEGSNFGSDTTGLKVYFQDSLGVKHPAGLVGSNGRKIYAMVPKLTYLRSIDIIVERVQEGGKTVTTKSNEPFIYKTQTTVSTVVGRPETDNQSLPTVGGDFTTATFSSPFAI